MKYTLLLIAVLTYFQKTYAQTGSAEVMAGHSYLHYQHTLAQSLKPDSRLGWQHVATVVKRYNHSGTKERLPDELMNQAYLSVRLTPSIAFKSGLFYTNGGGYKPAIGLNYFLRKKDYSIALSPRVDVAKKGAYELFAAAEVYPPLTTSLRFYARLQAMTNMRGTHHNRSYQLVRIGIDVKGIQLGGGLTLDEYGNGKPMHYNAGLFIRKKW